MPEPQLYRTISGPSSGEYREKGSKFLAFAYPVDSEDDITQCLGELRKQFHDARHHCYAWVLGPDSARFRANDDGEPGHSAGDPILGQIRSYGLTNTLVVVVRYFGGTKLGVSGLIQAYRTSAAEALEAARVKVVPVTTEFTITYSYDATSEVMRLVDEMNATVLDQEFTEICRMKMAVNVSVAEQVPERIELLKQLGHEVELN